MALDPKKRQKAAEKRKKREQKVREEQARKRTASQNLSVHHLLAEGAQLPISDCVISKGWEERGLAHILLARKRPDGTVLVAGFYVDTFCIGLKDTAVIPRLTEQEYEEKVKPTIFHDEVELIPCDPALARAVVEGAIAFAAPLGFHPNKRWEESRILFGDIVAQTPAPTFGKGGMPCYVQRGESNAKAIVTRLERHLKPGEYQIEEAPAA